MNVISCAKKCKHQNDGYCNLEEVVAITGSGSDGCCYYEHASTDPNITLNDCQNSE